MSFFETSLAVLDQIGKKTKEIAEAGVAQTQVLAHNVADYSTNKMNELKSIPKLVVCHTCQQPLPVPDDIFNWNCVNGHAVVNNDVCQECQAKKPLNKQPMVKCDVCNTQTEVPSSVMMMHILNAPVATKKFLIETNDVIQTEVKHQISDPIEFNCRHCNSLLNVPVGPWICQTCNTTNNEDMKLCSVCDGPKSSQQVKCGACNKSTPIPSSNFTNSFVANTRKLQRAGNKIILDLAKKKYVICSLCELSMEIPSNDDNSMFILSDDGVKQLVCTECGTKNDVIANNNERNIGNDMSINDELSNESMEPGVDANGLEL